MTKANIIAFRDRHVTGEAAAIQFTTFGFTAYTHRDFVVWDDANEIVTITIANTQSFNGYQSDLGEIAIVTIQYDWIFQLGAIHTADNFKDKISELLPTCSINQQNMLKVFADNVKAQNIQYEEGKYTPDMETKERTTSKSYLSETKE